MCNSDAFTIPNLGMPPNKLHTVAWSNPQISKVPYDLNTVADARASEYIEWLWDQNSATVSGHDVWLMASSEAAASCDFAGATEIIPASQEATIDPDSNSVKPGRNLYKIPEDAAGKTLYFACAVGNHCVAGQVIAVAVGTAPTQPDPDSDQGVCEESYELCKDQSKQTDTSAQFETKVRFRGKGKRESRQLHHTCAAVFKFNADIHN